VLSQYYVGASTNSEIAIFQGVRGSVLGVALNREVQGSCTPGAAASCEAIRLDDLNQSARLNVQAGIPATSLGDAQATLQRLRTQQVLPECPKPTTTPTSTPPQTGTNGSPTTGTRTTTAVPPTTGTSGNASSGIGSNVGSGTATPPTTSYVPPVSHPQPGIDCRKPGS
jgi:protein phosphatase